MVQMVALVVLYNIINIMLGVMLLFTHSFILLITVALLHSVIYSVGAACALIHPNYFFLLIFRNMTGDRS